MSVESGASVCMLGLWDTEGICGEIARAKIRVICRSGQIFRDQTPSENVNSAGDALLTPPPPPLHLSPPPHP